MRISMFEKNPKRRFNVKPNKPVKKMTEEGIDALAKEMFNRIMGTLPECQESNEK